MKPTNLVLEPVISEKSLKDAKNLNEYTFFVPRAFNKYQIKEAVEKTFGVGVVSVKTAMTRGRTKRVAGRLEKTTTPDLKKAFVRLAEKDKIELFEEMEKEK